VVRASKGNRGSKDARTTGSNVKADSRCREAAIPRAEEFLVAAI
jgi:hypothetical protein